jgi:hypothetical protein
MMLLGTSVQTPQNQADRPRSCPVRLPLPPRSGGFGVSDRVRCDPREASGPPAAQPTRAAARRPRLGGRRVPSMAEVTRLLRRLLRVVVCNAASSGDYVLPGVQPGERIRSLRKAWLRLCAAAQLSELRLHDRRHSFGSVGAAGGLSLPIIGALLGHKQPVTTARYAHLVGSPLHDAVDAIGAKMLAAMNSRAA